MSLLFAAERFCLALSWRISKLFPVVLVNGLLTWGIWSLIYSVLIPEFSPGCYRQIIGLLATVIYGLAVFTYFQIIYLGGGSPIDIPGFAMIGPDGVELDEAGPPPAVVNNVTAKDNGQMRYCSKCMCWKPDRTHHCRTCRTCVLRMDHHCPWFAACIGFRNHKSFLLFLLYTVVFCFVVFSHSFYSLYLFMSDDDRLFGDDVSVNVVFLTVISGIMLLTVTIFTSYCYYNLFKNQTTIEALEHIRYRTNIPADKYRYTEAPTSMMTGNIFDIGYKANICSLLGDNPYLWFLPVYTTPGDGTSFPINQKVWRQIQSIANKEFQAVEQNRVYQEQYHLEV